MKATNLTIRIPEPCQENWNNMTPDETGRFCGSCCKSVVDFSNKTDDEITDFLLRYKDQKVCGRFKKAQVDRPLKISIDMANLPKNMSVTKTFVVALLCVFGTTLFSCYDLRSRKIEGIEIASASYTMGAPTVPEFPPDTTATEADITGKIKSDSSEASCGETYLSGDVVIEQADTLAPAIRERELYMTMGLVAPDFVPQDTSTAEDSTQYKNELQQEKPGKDFALDIFPNPSNGDFVLKYKLIKQGRVQVNIFDDSGILIKKIAEIKQENPGEYTLPVNLTQLQNGVYFVSLTSDSEKVTKRLILEK